MKIKNTGKTQPLIQDTGPVQPLVQDTGVGDNKVRDEVREAMRTLANKLRCAAYWCDDGYYTTEAESAANTAKRGTWEEIARCIDESFDVDSELSMEQRKRR